MPNLDPFFTEWATRGPGQGRSLSRAAMLLRALDLERERTPVLGVVGAKGKGSTRALAAATLAAAGLRPGVGTGPRFRCYRERVGVDGMAVTDTELPYLGEALETPRRTLPAVEEFGGYVA